MVLEKNKITVLECDVADETFCLQEIGGMSVHEAASSYTTGTSPHPQKQTERFR